MKKIKKLTLSELENVVTIIEQQTIVGGSDKGYDNRNPWEPYTGGGSNSMSGFSSYTNFTNDFFGDSASQAFLNTPSSSSSGTSNTSVTEVKINGGTLVSYNNSGKKDDYTVYQGNDGSLVVFEGVTAKNDYAPDGSAYQLNGTVHVGAGPTACFDVGTMVHEYGHHLQEESWGTFPYAIAAGLGSLIGRLDESIDYYKDIPTESNANERGQGYIDQYYPNSGITPPTK